jgi:2-amino-4-hydroxy-6-hydroxymethyldihydropteridine diphosphokinase
VKVEGRRQKAEERQLAIIALGSNLGDSAAILRRAMLRLATFSDHPLQRSSLWRTQPVDCPPGAPAFVNAVVALQPRANHTPETLLIKLQALETEFGRQPSKVRHQPRPLDLDLIAFGHNTRSGPELVLPHPRAHLRRFVLQPLCEIAPELVLPGQSASVREILHALQTDESLVCLGQL